MRITDRQIEHYREHGYVIVENFLEPGELARARDEIEVYIPGWLGYAANPRGAKPEGWDKPARSRRTTRFPFPGTQLNAITLHPELRRFASVMNGQQALYCEQSDLSYKCKEHPADKDQHMHVDYINHTLAYPPVDPTYWQTTYLVYYTDVTEDQAPTAVCSERHYANEIRWPPFHSPEERPSLYENEVKATVPAGSLLAYSVRTFHRGTAFKKEGARVSQFISYSPAACPWLGINGWPEQGTRPEFRDWIERAEPREREIFGFPAPGHPYWSEETLAGVGARYPEMDLSPYRDCPKEEIG
ncbi:MAG: phytanoyl-CoA dioxygenase family protein [Gammaproteobacteria bacterium]|nr:phytanoyl-CoA dioxygenase family protein [Gammaproteobacteria bacterium]